MPEATWEPHEKHGRLTMQSDLPDSVFAFPKQRKEPLTDAQHVRNAVARFDQVIERLRRRSRLGVRQHRESGQLLWRKPFGERRGTISGSIRNAIGKKPPPRAWRPANASGR